MSVSLDGFIETQDGEIDWAIIDEEFHTLANEQAREKSAFLYGRRMYDLMASAWPKVAEDNSAPAYMLEFAHIWKDKSKIVFSKTLEKVGWNSTLVTGNIVEEVNRLKALPGKDMSIGGAGIAAAFMQHDLIDEFHPFIHPVVLGFGTPYFPRLEKAFPLKLIETRTLGSGVIYLRCRRVDGAR